MALEGSLHDLSLIDLVQVLQIGLKTGVLWLNGGAEHGVVYVREGSPIDAMLVRGPARQAIATADDAMIRLLQWEDATFTFQPDPMVDRHPIRIVHDHEWLIHEAVRRRWEPLPPQTRQAIGLDTRLALARQPGAVNGAFKLDLQQWRILGQVAVSPSARAICATTGQAADQVLASLAQLLSLGLIEAA
jgi:hypothetical protein